ncbi:MAG: hypothetical protein R2752_13345 [Vicinamibacterales bacterium]
MKPWEIIARARTPDGTELALARHPSEFVLLAGGESLMTSRVHQTEDALGTLGCRLVRERPHPVVLIGGLGMGFTLRAALDTLPADARVVVAELVPEVVAWNRGPLGPLAGLPLDDPRVTVEVADVAAVLRACPGGFDAVLLDVDNGPVAFTAAPNAWLYGPAGVAVTRAALRPGGVVGVWSTEDDRPYARRLRQAGFHVEIERVKRRRTRGGHRDTILLAR